jgi:hypothetical protein
MCQLRKGVAQKLKTYQEKAAKAYLTITSRTRFQTKYEEGLAFEENMKKKLGYYRKALVLYDSGNY